MLDFKRREAGVEVEVRNAKGVEGSTVVAPWASSVALPRVDEGRPKAKPVAAAPHDAVLAQS